MGGEQGGEAAEEEPEEEAEVEEEGEGGGGEEPRGQGLFRCDTTIWPKHKKKTNSLRVSSYQILYFSQAPVI